MMDVETTTYSDFINCDRTGRRNAVPDIVGEQAIKAGSTSELSKDMAEMDLKATGGQFTPTNEEKKGESGGSPPPEGEGSTSGEAPANGEPS